MLLTFYLNYAKKYLSQKKELVMVLEMHENAPFWFAVIDRAGKQGYAVREGRKSISIIENGTVILEVPICECVTATEMASKLVWFFTLGYFKTVLRKEVLQGVYTLEQLLAETALVMINEKNQPTRLLFGEAEIATITPEQMSGRKFAQYCVRAFLYWQIGNCVEVPIRLVA